MGRSLRRYDLGRFTFRGVTRRLRRSLQHLAGDRIEHCGKAECDRAPGSNRTNPCEEIAGVVWLVRVRIFQQDFHCLAVLRHRRHDIAFFFIDATEHFQERHIPWPCRQIFPQQRLRQPIVLPLHGFPCQRFERCPSAHEASQSQMEGGEETPGFCVERVES